jgi:NO-binding membrane sensor protein with MHYT domain
MRPTLKRGILVTALFLASAYCFLGMWATVDLSAYNDPTAAGRAYAWLAGSVLLGTAGIWQLVILVKRRSRESLL